MASEKRSRAALPRFAAWCHSWCVSSASAGGGGCSSAPRTARGRETAIGVGESVGGSLMRDGELAPVVACETDSELDPELGCQRRFTLDVTDERERHASVRGEAIAVAPLRQRRNGRLTLVNEGLTEYEWDGM